MRRPFNMRYIWLFFLFPMIGISQTKFREASEIAVDSLYREDQFYIGVTYNFLADSPAGTRSSGFSGGIQGGFLRDMPINKNRNIAIAVGIGFAYDQFGSNLFVGESPNGESIFRVLDNTVDYAQNRFQMASVELPIEFRWRTSTPIEYRFWRVYAGGRIGYAYWYKASFKQLDNVVYRTSISEFDPIRLSATFGFGYNTVNFFGSYSFNPFYKDAFTVDGKKIDFKTVKVGLMFYIL